MQCVDKAVNMGKHAEIFHITCVMLEDFTTPLRWQ